MTVEFITTNDTLCSHFPSLSEIVANIDAAVGYWNTREDDPHHTNKSLITNYSFTLAKNNRLQWNAEDRARTASATDAEVASIKREIDELNCRRVGLINTIHNFFYENYTAKNSKAPVSFVSPADVIDRLSILKIRKSVIDKNISSGTPCIDSKRLLDECRLDIIHETKHLDYILRSLKRGSFSLNQRRITKIYQ